MIMKKLCKIFRKLFRKKARFISPPQTPHNAEDFFKIHFPDTYISGDEVHRACRALKDDGDFLTVIRWMSDQRELALSASHSKFAIANPNVQTFNMNSAAVINSLLTNMDFFMKNRLESNKNDEEEVI